MAVVVVPITVESIREGVCDKHLETFVLTIERLVLLVNLTWVHMRHFDVAKARLDTYRKRMRAMVAVSPFLGAFAAVRVRDRQAQE